MSVNTSKKKKSSLCVYFFTLRESCGRLELGDGVSIDNRVNSL